MANPKWEEFGSEVTKEPYDEDGRRTLLLAGLVGPHIPLWHQSPRFHAAIQTLAELLPVMVEGLVAQAERDKLLSDEAMRELLNRPLLPHHVGPDGKLTY